MQQCSSCFCTASGLIAISHVWKQCSVVQTSRTRRTHLQVVLVRRLCMVRQERLVMQLVSPVGLEASRVQALQQLVLAHAWPTAKRERVNHVAHVHPAVVKRVGLGSRRKVQRAGHFLHKHKSCRTRGVDGRVHCV
eukprot:350747-Chlamydomonas_euryale.AAC.7